MGLRPWQRFGGAGRELPLALGPAFSYRPLRELITLDGSGNVELIANEVTLAAADDLIQTVLADRPAWAAIGTAGPPSLQGDGLSDNLVGGPAHVAAGFYQNPFTVYCLYTDSGGGGTQTVVGPGATFGVAATRFRTSGSAIGYQLGGATVAGGLPAVNQAVWVEALWDGANLSLADSTGGAATIVAGAAPAMDLASMCARYQAGAPIQLSDREIYWWIGYPTALPLALRTLLRSYFAGVLGI